MSDTENEIYDSDEGEFEPDEVELLDADQSNVENPVLLRSNNVTRILPTSKEPINYPAVNGDWLEIPPKDVEFESPSFVREQEIGTDIRLSESQIFSTFFTQDLLEKSV